MDLYKLYINQHKTNKFFFLNWNDLTLLLQDLENAAGETLDYSRMNRDLSQSATTMSPEGAAKAAATLAALEDIEQEEEGSIVPPTKSEPITDQVSFNYKLSDQS